MLRQIVSPIVMAGIFFTFILLGVLCSACRAADGDRNWIDRQKEMFDTMTRRASTADREGFISGLHPTAQNLIDEDKLNEQLRRLQARL